MIGFARRECRIDQKGEKKQGLAGGERSPGQKGVIPGKTFGRVVQKGEVGGRALPKTEEKTEISASPDSAEKGGITVGEIRVPGGVRKKCRHFVRRDHRAWPFNIRRKQQEGGDPR